MNSDINYSVVIRTLGTSGDMYVSLLNSISAQSVSPAEVIVVIPDGYDVPCHIEGERIVRASKGMVNQRAVGIASANAEYLLIVDDDISFPPDYVEQMFSTLKQRNLDCVTSFGIGSPIVEPEGPVPFRTQMRRRHLAFTGQAFYSRRSSHFFDTVSSTGGHRVFVNHPDALCQLAVGCCMFIKTSAAKAVRFDEELWLERGSYTKYAAYDDAVFSYKLFLNGGRIAYCQTSDYLHLNAATGRTATNAIQSRSNRLYAIARNRTIYWYRFIYSRQRTLRSFFGGIYGIVNYALWNLAINLPIPSHWPAIKAMFIGYTEALNEIKHKQ